MGKVVLKEGTLLSAPFYFSSFYVQHFSYFNATT